jgi:hypothetical protein
MALSWRLFLLTFLNGELNSTAKPQCVLSIEGSGI